jgi:hypothetical protein
MSRHQLEVMTSTSSELCWLYLFIYVKYSSRMTDWQLVTLIMNDWENSEICTASELYPPSNKQTRTRNRQVQA